MIIGFASGGMIGFYVPAASAGITGLVKLMMLGGVGGAASGIGGRAVMTAVSGDWSNWQEEIFSFRRIVSDFAFSAVGGAIGFGVRRCFSYPLVSKELYKRVGRWMSQNEFGKMVDTGLVQESYTGTTHVSFPADFYSYYKQAKIGSVYAEFDIPASSLKLTGNGWGKIIGPKSLEGRFALRNNLPIPQMPIALNIILLGKK